MSSSSRMPTICPGWNPSGNIARVRLLIMYSSWPYVRRSNLLSGAQIAGFSAFMLHCNNIGSTIFIGVPDVRSICLDEVWKFHTCDSAPFVPRQTVHRDETGWHEFGG